MSPVVSLLRPFLRLESRCHPRRWRSLWGRARETASTRMPSTSRRCCHHEDTLSAFVEAIARSLPGRLLGLRACPMRFSPRRFGCEVPLVGLRGASCVDEVRGASCGVTVAGLQGNVRLLLTAFTIGKPPGDCRRAECALNALNTPLCPPFDHRLLRRPFERRTPFMGSSWCQTTSKNSVVQDSMQTNIDLTSVSDDLLLRRLTTLVGASKRTEADFVDVRLLHGHAASV